MHSEIRNIENQPVSSNLGWARFGFGGCFSRFCLASISSETSSLDKAIIKNQVFTQTVFNIVSSVLN